MKLLKIPTIALVAAVSLSCLFTLLREVSTSAQTKEPAITSADQRLIQLVHPRIVVRKRDRKLELYSDKKLVKTYRVALGFNPEPDKEREGDGATPEGEFYVFVKNVKSAYYLSLGLSYPNEEDAARGLKEGLITRQSMTRFYRLFSQKRCRPSTQNWAV